MLPEGNWITRAPTLKRKAILLAKVQDEGGHGLYLYAAAETLGTSRDQMIEALHCGQGQVQLDLQLPDADLGRHRRDRLAGRRRGDHEPGAAAAAARTRPYARAMVRICREESFHQRQGFDALLTMMTQGTDAQRAMVQDAVNRWWWPSPDDVRPARRPEPEQRRSRCAGASSASSNDDLRQKFVDATRASRPRCSASRCPTRDLKWNDAARRTTTSAPSTGASSGASSAATGPCNRERLAARVQGLGRRRLGARGGAGACPQTRHRSESAA